MHDEETPPEKRDMAEGCEPICSCVWTGRTWCFPFFRWLSQISGGDLFVNMSRNNQLCLGTVKSYFCSSAKTIQHSIFFHMAASILLVRNCSLNGNKVTISNNHQEIVKNEFANRLSFSTNGSNHSNFLNGEPPPIQRLWMDSKFWDGSNHSKNQGIQKCLNGFKKWIRFKTKTITKNAHLFSTSYVNEKGPRSSGRGEQKIK